VGIGALDHCVVCVMLQCDSVAVVRPTQYNFTQKIGESSVSGDEQQRHQHKQQIPKQRQTQPFIELTTDWLRMETRNVCSSSRRDAGYAVYMLSLCFLCVRAPLLGLRLACVCVCVCVFVWVSVFACASRCCLCVFFFCVSICGNQTHTHRSQTQFAITASNHICSTCSSQEYEEEKEVRFHITHTHTPIHLGAHTHPPLLTQRTSTFTHTHPHRPHTVTVNRLVKGSITHTHALTTHARTHTPRTHPQPTHAPTTHARTQPSTHTEKQKFCRSDSKMFNKEGGR